MNGQCQVGLVLSGGGARGSYQSGAIKAIAEITEKLGISQPFPVLSGLSAGAINAGYLAGHDGPMTERAQGLCSVWENLETEHVINTSAFSIGRIGLRWFLDLLTGQASLKRSRALLDTTPLGQLIHREISFENIKKNIDDGTVKGLVITAVSYTDGYNCNFYQVKEELEPWQRVRRMAERTEIGPEHIMASAAIPILFPPTKIGERFYGDGSLRNYTPLSPAIKLGAEKLIVIAVRRHEQAGDIEDGEAEPTIGRILGVVLNAVLLDAIDLDYERLTRINRTLRLIPPGADTPLRPVDVCLIRPSEDIARIALEQVHHMPKVLHHMISGLGAPKEVAGLISYLLFEKAFTKRLVALGYQDAMAKREEIINLYSTPPRR